MFSKIFFQRSLQERQDRAQKQIDETCFHIHPKRLKIVCHLCTRHLENLLYGEHCAQRGVFGEADEIVSDGRHRDQSRLRDNDVADCLRPADVERMGGFPLAFGHRCDCGADDFGVVGALTDDQAHGRRDERTQDNAELWQSVENDEQLDQKRRTADDPHVKFGDRLQHLRV